MSKDIEDSPISRMTTKVINERKNKKENPENKKVKKVKEKKEKEI